MTETNAPGLGHRLFFWFLLATLSMALPEVLGTLNDPIPWAHRNGWTLGYPVYGLHVLFLAGLMYRFPIAGLTTLLAYGGLFGLYEGYLIKQLWNPNWGETATLSIGGVRVLHTLLLVFWTHPLMAFILPLVLCELLAVAPGRLSARLPFITRTRRRRLVFLLLVALYFGITTGKGLEGRGAIGIPIISLVIFAALGLAWRLGFRGQRWRLEDLLPRRTGLVVLAVLLAVEYGVYGSQLRAEAFPGAWLPHVLVWGIYAFLVAVIVRVTRRTAEAPVEDRPAPSNTEAFALSAAWGAVVLFIAWWHAPYRLPGEPLAVITFLGGSVAVLAWLAWSLIAPHRPAAKQDALQRRASSSCQRA